MEFKKEYFPTAKAPEIAKKTVMQYIYWTKKNLNKRFYFYRVYAPAFLLLFVVWWWMTYYNKINRPSWEIYTFKNDSWISSGFIENNKISQKIANVSDTSMINNNSNINNNIASNSISNNIVVSDNTTSNTNIGSAVMKWNQSNPTQVSSVNAATVNNTSKTLSQQISEIEILMNDISSITKQEEILF